MQKLKFNVFGNLMFVERKSSQWLLFKDSDCGIATRVYDVVIPADLAPNQIAHYLDDIYHEYATNKHPNVVSLTAIV